MILFIVLLYSRIDVRSHRLVLNAPGYEAKSGPVYIRYRRVQSFYHSVTLSPVYRVIECVSESFGENGGFRTGVDDNRFAEDARHSFDYALSVIVQFNGCELVKRGLGLDEYLTGLCHSLLAVLHSGDQQFIHRYDSSPCDTRLGR